MGPIGCPETSVSNHLTQRNNPGDGKIKFIREGSLRPRNTELRFKNLRLSQHKERRLVISNNPLASRTLAAQTLT